MIGTPSSEKGLKSGSSLGAITIRNVHGQSNTQSGLSLVANTWIVIIVKRIEATILRVMDTLDVIPTQKRISD